MGRIGSEFSEWCVWMKHFYFDQTFIPIICVCINITSDNSTLSVTTTHWRKNGSEVSDWKGARSSLRVWTCPVYAKYLYVIGASRCHTPPPAWTSPSGAVHPAALKALRPQDTCWLISWGDSLSQSLQHLFVGIYRAFAVVVSANVAKCDDWWTVVLRHSVIWTGPGSAADCWSLTHWQDYSSL